MVDLPLPESPVNQIVKPRCFRRLKRSERERDGCQVMLLGRGEEGGDQLRGLWEGRVGRAELGGDVPTLPLGDVGVRFEREKCGGCEMGA